jgi:hypothetical protein
VVEQYYSTGCFHTSLDFPALGYIPFSIGDCLYFGLIVTSTLVLISRIVENKLENNGTANQFCDRYFFSFTFGRLIITANPFEKLKSKRIQRC